MKNLLFIMFFIIMAGCSQNNKTNLVSMIVNDDTISLPTTQNNSLGLATPESVVVYNRNIYVANIGGNPMESLQKGFITKISNNVATNLFVGLLDDPKGFAFLNNDTIIVSDHPNVKLLKISTGKIIATLPIENPGFLNDLTLINDTTALLSDTGKGLVYKISIDKNQLSYVTVSGINENGINGLAYNHQNKKLYFVTSIFGGDNSRGHIFEAILNDDFTIATSLNMWNTPQIGAGGLDGVSLVNNKLIISDWGINAQENASFIYIYNIENKSLETSISGIITSAADIVFDNNNIYIPEFLKNQLSIIEISDYI